MTLLTLEATSKNKRSNTFEVSFDFHNDAHADKLEFKNILDIAHFIDTSLKLFKPFNLFKLTISGYESNFGDPIIYFARDYKNYECIEIIEDIIKNKDFLVV